MVWLRLLARPSYLHTSHSRSPQSLPFDFGSSVLSRKFAIAMRVGPATDGYLSGCQRGARPELVSGGELRVQEGRLLTVVPGVISRLGVAMIAGLSAAAFGAGWPQLLLEPAAARPRGCAFVAAAVAVAAGGVGLVGIAVQSSRRAHHHPTARSRQLGVTWTRTGRCGADGLLLGLWGSMLAFCLGSADHNATEDSPDGHQGSRWLSGFRLPRLALRA